MLRLPGRPERTFPPPRSPRVGPLCSDNEGLWAWNYCRQLHTPQISDQEKSGPRSSSCDVTSRPRGPVMWCQNTGAGSDTSQDRKLSRFTQCSPLFRILTFIGLNIYLLNKCQMKWMWHTFLIHTVDDSVNIFLHCKSSILCPTDAPDVRPIGPPGQASRIEICASN